MIKVKLFAVLRERVARDELTMESSGVNSVREVLSRLVTELQLPSSLLEHCLMAINGEYAPQDARLSPGDELAILPPVSGG